MARYYKIDNEDDPDEYIDSPKITYMAVSHESDHNGSVPKAEVHATVVPSSEQPNFGGKWTNEGEQLFRNSPGVVHIHEAYANRIMRHYIPTLAALAIGGHPGHVVTVSDDLSIHSSPLVKHAMKRGLIHGPTNGNEDAEVTNEIDAEDFVLSSAIVSGLQKGNYYGITSSEVPPHRVLQARQFIRTALGRRNPKQVVPTPTPPTPQDRLPGL